MTDRHDHLRRLGCRLLGSFAVAAALAVGTAASGYGQSVDALRPQNGGPEGAVYDAPAPAPAVPQTALPAMRDSVAETETPCGGDFGMLGGLEADRRGVPEANPCDAPVCE